MAFELMFTLIVTLAVAIGMWVTFQRNQKLKPIRIKSQYRKKDRWDDPNQGR